MPTVRRAELDYEFIVENCPLCCCRDCSLSFLNPQPDARNRGAPPPDAGDVFTKSMRPMQEGGWTSSLLMRGPSRHTAAVGAEVAQDEAARRGFEVVCLTPVEFDDYGLKDGGGLFVGCILNCALEQTSDPLARLATVSSLLSPDGCLMVIAPTLDSRTARVFRSTWWEFKRHNRYYFTSDTMQSLLIKGGFGDPIIMPDDSVVSLQYMRRKLATLPPAWR